MKVYLIRHAQSEENQLDMRARTSVSAFNEIVRSSHASPLTEQGQRQAQALVERLAGAGIERLYSSPFARSLATATTLGAALGLTPELVDDLREVMPPPLGEGRRDAALGRLFVRSYLAMLWPRASHETWRLARRRARQVWAELTAEQSGTIAIVSHRAFIFLILLSLRRDRRWRILARDFSNGGVSIVARSERL